MATSAWAASEKVTKANPHTQSAWHTRLAFGPFCLGLQQFLLEPSCEKPGLLLDGLSVNGCQVVNEENVEVEIKLGKILNRHTSIIGVVQ